MTATSRELVGGRSAQLGLPFFSALPRRGSGSRVSLLAALLLAADCATASRPAVHRVTSSLSILARS